MIRHLSGVGVYGFLKETLHTHENGKERRRRRESREVLANLDALDNRLAEIEAVQRGILEHVLATQLQWRPDCEAGLRGTKEDLPRCVVITAAEDDNGVEIVGFVPQRRSSMTSGPPVKREKKNVNKDSFF